MKNLPILLLILIPSFGFAQLYADASNNLPDNGAKGASMDVKAADLDGDGDMDVVLANEFQANTILLNDGNALFSNGTSNNLPQETHDSEDVAIADFNGDGFLDLIFCSEDDVTLGWTEVHEYYLGNGQGGFVAAPYQFPDSEANAVIWAYINADTLPDVLFGNNGGTGVFINNGDGSFTGAPDRISQLNRTTQDLAMADVDGDNDLDLFEANEDGNVLHINDGNGYFTDESALRLPQGLNQESRKATFGDIDGDGDADLFLSNVAFIPGKNPQNRLLLNNGSGVFSDVTSNNLPTDADHTIDAIFEDVDLDQDLDLVVCNVFGGPVHIYANGGNGIFTVNTSDVLGQHFVRDALGVIAEDFNGDGFRDLYICDRKTNQSNNKDLLLLRNPIVNSTKKAGQEKLVLYPNPAADHFYLNSTVELPKEMTLHDLNGRFIRVLRPEKRGKGLYFIKIKGLPSGVYWIHVGEIRKKIKLGF